MLRRGYIYFDWDASSGGVDNTSDAYLNYSTIIEGVSDNGNTVVSMHDAVSPEIVAAFPLVLSTLLNAGYGFDALDKSVRPSWLRSEEVMRF
jgi:hypothetical protein